MPEVDTTPIFGSTVSGVNNRVRHIKIGEDETVKPTDVQDWIAGFAASVNIRLGDLQIIDDVHETRIRLAARRIVEAYVAGDVLDAAFQVQTGRNEDPPGEHLRKMALLELEALVGEVDLLRAQGAESPAGLGQVGIGFPRYPMVRKAMRF